MGLGQRNFVACGCKSLHMRSDVWVYMAIGAGVCAAVSVFANVHFFGRFVQAKHTFAVVRVGEADVAGHSLQFANEIHTECWSSIPAPVRYGCRLLSSNSKNKCK